MMETEQGNAEERLGEIMRLLVVEDDRRIAARLKKGLVEDSHVVDVIHDGREGLAMAEEEIYDAIVLEAELPGKNGFEIVAQLREDEIATPVLMLTDRSTLADRVEYFDAGVDDYLSKPFAFQELTARLRAIGRRAGSIADDQVLAVADLEMDLRAHEVTREGRIIELAPREYTLLEYLMRNQGHALTRAMILDQVWDYTFDSLGNVVDTSIRRLRKAVDEGFDKPLIQTVRGVGYKIRA
jgi:two-component system OmpR family response regulator